MKKEFIVSSLITLAFLSLGFALIYFRLIGYGLTIFVFLPLALGFYFGSSTVKNWSLLGMAISTLIFFILLIAGGLEGMVCVLMALPLVAGAILIGYVIKMLFIKYFRSREKDNTSAKISIIPILLLIAIGAVENVLISGKENIMEVRTEIILPYTTMQVYDAIKSVDTLYAEKPWLMKLDLPVPYKCVLEDEKIGALRTCYFEYGHITERVTAIEKGKLLKMDVINYQLPIRNWLGFKEAIYTFDELEGGGCKLTRITTYTSELYPRAYWKPFEKLGISQEHEYVFRNLVKDLKASAGN